MKHRTDEQFWSAYDLLPPDVRRRADDAFQKLKVDPKHPSLHFKKIGRRWAARIDRKHRALALEIDDGYLWYWIGSHDEYERLIKSS